MHLENLKMQATLSGKYMQNCLLIIKQNMHLDISLNFVLIIIKYHLLSNYPAPEPSVVYMNMTHVLSLRAL